MLATQFKRTVHCPLPTKSDRLKAELQTRFLRRTIMSKIDRRDFMKLAGLGGVVFASGLGFNAFGTGMIGREDFYFVQLSDTHWGFDGPKVNPDAQGTLKKAVAMVNSLNEQPDFVVFTGD